VARILVADDDFDIARMIETKMIRAGHDVVIVGTGNEALSEAQTCRFDMAILDVMMPGMDGFEVLRRIKADPSTSSLPCIMLTARSHEKDVVTGLSSGAVDYVRKPFSMNELLIRVDTHLSRR
jgi:DNA-binding response OmpR family regulator